MSVIKFIPLVALIVIVALGSSDAVQFPGLGLITDCIDKKCGVRIRSCMRANEWEINRGAKGCIVGQCRNALKLCLKDFPSGLIDTAKTVAKLAEDFVDVGLDVFSDSYLQCWLDMDIFNGTQLTDCVIDDLLNRMEPYINLIGSMVFSDPAYMACWMVQVGRAFTSMVINANEDTKYTTQMELNMEAEAERNLYDYMTCIASKNTKDERCVHAWNRVLGTPKWMKQKSKDLGVAVIQDIITASIKCRKS
ncbi:uncharacterized protein LOC134457276 [Engraulis encrasicolus]|uniref:uncharacterized protein LOC134457276 n=1 Tax=Engraulis encrasicolus TaxID=184585 RepID=UPI002FD788E2